MRHEFHAGDRALCNALREDLVVEVEYSEISSAKGFVDDELVILKETRSFSAFNCLAKYLELISRKQLRRRG